MDALMSWSRRGYPPAIERLRSRVRLGWWNRIAVGRGWWPLLARLEEQLAYLDPNFALTRVAAHDGALLFDAVPEHESVAFDDAVWEAMLAASRTCEVCAAPGTRRPDAHRILCGDHARPLTASERAFLTGAGMPEEALTASTGRGNDAHDVASAAFFDGISRTHLPATEMGRILGLDVESVYQRYVDVELAGAEREGRVVFPRWQLAPDGTLPGLHRILRALPDPDDSVTTRAFMLNPTEELDGMSPKQWLEQVGAVAAVTALIISLRHT